MKGIAVKTLVTLVIIVAVLLVMSSIFLFGLQLSPLEANKIFSEGCFSYCTQISSEAAVTGERIEIVAVRLGEAIKDSGFIKACNFLYPDTIGFPYLCWNRNCCRLNIPPP